MNQDYTKLGDMLTAKGENSKFVRLVAQLCSISGGIMLIGFAMTPAAGAFSSYVRWITGLATITFFATIPVLGSRYLSKTGRISMAGVWWRLLLLFFVLPIVLTVLIVALGYYFHAPGINPK